jgi:hypothetical protein
MLLMLMLLLLVRLTMLPLVYVSKMSGVKQKDDGFYEYVKAS